LVRFWSRRWAAQIADRAENVHVQHVQVVEAVNAAVGTLDADTNVVAVAHQLGVDRSVASRMISAAVAAGYVRKEGSPADARRAIMRLTDRGRELLAASHRWQQETFDSLVAHWDEADQRRLADYLQRLTAEVIEALSAGQDRGT
jgi:DNA-binding MarR family transcriptional regulator